MESHRKWSAATWWDCRLTIRSRPALLSLPTSNQSYACDDHILGLKVPVDYEVGMQVDQSTAELPNEERYLLLLQPNPPHLLALIEVLVGILVSCILEDEVDELLVMEEAIEFGNVGVANKGVDFDLSENVLFNLEIPHLLFIE